MTAILPDNASPGTASHMQSSMRLNNVCIKAEIDRAVAKAIRESGIPARIATTMSDGTPSNTRPNSQLSHARQDAAVDKVVEKATEDYGIPAGIVAIKRSGRSGEPAL